MPYSQQKQNAKDISTDKKMNKNTIIIFDAYLIQNILVLGLDIYNYLHTLEQLKN